ncbi:MAG: hypothetical protein AAF519_06950 [Bacteroidota bacterium]
MKLFTHFILFLIALHASYGQETIKSYYTKAFHCKKENECSAFGQGYRQDLLIQFNENELKWSKNIFEGFTVCEVRKKADHYIVALLDELYVYTDLTNTSVYYIDFVNDNYQTWGYGPDSAVVKSRVSAMMKMLENHATQKDVMQFLIDQTTGKN